MARWLDNPRTSRVRAVLFTVHLVAGLAIGLVLTVVSLSGSLLVFRPEIEESLYQPRVAVGPRRASLDTVVAAIVVSHPERRVFRVQLPRAVDQALEIVMSRRGARSLKEAQQLSVFADPYTGALLGEREKQSSPIFFLQDLHFSLLAGVPGLTINGVLSALLLLMCLTGLVIWWPGRPRWRNGFHVQWNASWKRVTWDLHGVLGFFSAALLVIFALTGLYYGFRQPLTRAVLTLTGSPPPLRAPEAKGGDRVSIDSVVASARGAMAGAHILALRFPATSAGVYVASATVRNHSGEGEDRIHVDGAGHVLRIDRPAELPFGARLLELVNPLHLGTFGGNLTRALWVLIGLVPPILFFSGFLLWWHRVVTPRIRARKLLSPSLPAYTPHA